jgi:hypothetical protein
MRTRDSRIKMSIVFIMTVVMHIVARPRMGRLLISRAD